MVRQQLLVFCVLLLVLQTIEGQKHHGRRASQASLPIINNVQYMYVLGVACSGVEAISPIVANIAKSCNMHVVYKNTYLRTCRLKSRAASYSAYLKSTKVWKYQSSNQVLVMEDGLFPYDGAMTLSSPDTMKADARYDIEWIYNQVQSVGGVEQRFLYVGRDPYQVIGANSPDTFKGRVQVVNEYLTHINLEYERIAAKKAGIWGQVHYEWFTELRNCTALVSAIIDFAGWDRCDVEYACELLRTSPPAEGATEDTLNVDNAEYAAKTIVEVSIPVLDISGTNAGNFTKAEADKTIPSFTSQPQPVIHPASLVSAESEVSTAHITHTHVRKPAVPVDRWHTYNTPVRNAVSLMYIVGVEGTGHHGVTPAVASIAKTCNYHIIYENAILRRYQAKLLPKSFASTIVSYRHAHYADTSKVLVVEDGSFPTGMDGRRSTPEQKKSIGKYNLEWVYEQALAAEAVPRFLHLTRDFYRAVASHPEFDNGFEPHAQVLHDFTQHIHSEYETINRRQPGLWRQVRYEWFMELRNCTALVSAIIDFAGWDGCDVEYACQVLRQTLRSSTARTVNETDLAYAQSFNMTSPVPLLDISENRTYAFQTVISPRVPFTIVQNVSTRVRVIRSNSSVLAVRTARYPAEGQTHNVQYTEVTPVVGNREVNNKVTMVYLAGVLGAGHDLVMRTLIAAARSCGYHVIYDHLSLRRAHAHLLARSYVSALHSFQRAIYRNSNKILVLDGSPFYADGERPTATLEEKRRNGKFDLLWVKDRAEDAGVPVKFLYLNRNFTEVLRASFDDTVPFAHHAQSVYDFTVFIDEQRGRVDAATPGLWAQVNYTQLVDPSVRCDEHVRALMMFMGLADCAPTPCSQLITNRVGGEYMRSLTPEELSVCETYVGKLELPIKVL